MAEYYPSGGFDLEQFPWKHGVDWNKNAPVIAVKIKLNSEEFKKGSEARVVCSVQAK